MRESIFNLMSGAVLIVIGIFIIAKEQEFPGWWALLPTVGAVLIISAGNKAWLNRVVLSSRVLVWFGLISFPLYLWHWPLLSFARIMEGETPAIKIRIATVLIAVFLAWLTYRFIEKPFRFGNYSKAKTITLIVLMVIVANAGYNTFRLDGMATRDFIKKFASYTPSIKEHEHSLGCLDVRFGFQRPDNWFCSIGDQSVQPSVFSYGDSHAFSLTPALEKFGIENHVNFLFVSSSGCPPLLGIQSMRGVAWTDQYNCKRLNDRIFEYVRDNKIKSVLLVARWSYYTGGTTRPLELNLVSTNAVDGAPNGLTKESSRTSFESGLKQTISKYREIGVNVIIAEDSPQQLYDPKGVLRKAFPLTDSSINSFSVSSVEHKQNQLWVSELIESHKNEIKGIINTDVELCKGGICPYVENGKFLYVDDDHLSVDGAMHA